MQRLTWRSGPKPTARRRRTGGIRGGFRQAAVRFTRRTLRAVHTPPAVWDTLTWLRLWEFNDSINDDPTQDYGHHGDPGSGLSEHPGP